MKSSQIIGVVIAAVVLLLIIAGISWIEKKLLKKRLSTAKFQSRWLEVQQLCHDKSTWPLAVIDSDKLLDEALKKRGFKGKSMGERLVSARQTLTDNDKTWFAHKLRNKLVHEEGIKLTEPMVKEALRGTRQALKDLGAL